MLVASYDLLLGYTGIVSFAHTMFFGIGGYGIAIALERLGADLDARSRSGSLAALALSAVLAVRHRPLVAARARDLLLDDHARGRLGRCSSWPRSSRPSPAARTACRSSCRRNCARRSGFSPSRSSASPINGRLLAYYLVFFVVARDVFLLLLRIVNSPFGRVLQAIRENEFRAEALGYRVVAYRTRPP